MTGPPWKHRPIETAIGVGMLALGVLILVSGGEYAPGYFQRLGWLVAMLYGTLAAAGGASLLYGLFLTWRSRGVDRIGGYFGQAIGNAILAAFIGAFVFGYVSNPIFMVPSTTTLVTLLTCVAIGLLLRAWYSLREARAISLTLREVVAEIEGE